MGIELGALGDLFRNEPMTNDQTAVGWESRGASDPRNPFISLLHHFISIL
jgi:hypothetical protein